jgi:hypothetical protein
MYLDFFPAGLLQELYPEDYSLVEKTRELKEFISGVILEDFDHITIVAQKA